MKDYLDLITAESIKEINEDKKGFDEFKDKFAYTMAEVETVLNKTDEMIRLKEKNRILQKALEMACQDLFEEFGCSKYYNKTCEKGDLEDVCNQCLEEEYLQRAKEMMKSE